MNRAILLVEPDLPQLRPLTRFRSAYSLRNGIFTPLERIRHTNPNRPLYYSHPEPEMERLLAAKEELRSFIKDGDGISHDELSQAGELAETDLNPFLMLDHIAERIQSDLKLVPGTFKPPVEIPDGVFIRGNRDFLLLAHDVEIGPGVVFDLRSGPIVLDRGCKVSAFSSIEGPLYAGQDSRLDHVRITGGCILGNGVRVGGEIENSIFNDFTNKHHEGFVGHSIVGSWVNFGALSTTSDLKNNYGEVKLDILETNHSGEKRMVSIPTGRIKFGSLIGDHVKIAIGTMINTGSILDAGSNIFGSHPKKYVPPLSWGDGDGEYRLERFLIDMEKIMGRRNRNPHDADRSLAARLSSLRN